jgi:transposase
LIDEAHPARKIWRVVEQLDLSRFASEVRAVEGVAGRPSHSPQVLAAVWIYAFSKGLHSAREIASSTITRYRTSGPDKVKR